VRWEPQLEATQGTLRHAQIMKEFSTLRALLAAGPKRPQAPATQKILAAVELIDQAAQVSRAR
jgi:hypothetical protein